MNEMTLTEEMRNTIRLLGEQMKADIRTKKVEAAMEEYEHSEELAGLIAEYNTQQNVIAGAIESTEEARAKIQRRIDELYTQITEHPVYTAYIDAKNEFDKLSNEVYAQLQYEITGERPCEHDCSSCGGCH